MQGRPRHGRLLLRGQELPRVEFRLHEAQVGLGGAFAIGGIQVQQRDRCLELLRPGLGADRHHGQQRFPLHLRWNCDSDFLQNRG